MERLVQQSDKNSPEAYDQIFKRRSEGEPHWQDVRRWKELIRYFKGGNIIDIGCLDSQISNYLYIKQGFNYLGTDVAEDAIQEMNRKYEARDSDGSPLISFLVDDIYSSKIKPGIADYVVMGEILEHLENPYLAIHKAFEILKPGGTLALSVPLEESKEPGAVDGERHLWSYNKEDMKFMLAPYSSKIKFKTLRSKWFPYKYCWPTLVCWAQKDV